MFDRTILSLLCVCLIFILLSLHYGLRSDKTEKELDTYKKMVGRNCNCHPWR